MQKDSFFGSVKRWSQRKHRLLDKYLPPFSAKVGSWAKEIYCIDGFAGTAKYDDGKEGSPYSWPDFLTGVLNGRSL